MAHHIDRLHLTAGVYYMQYQLLAIVSNRDLYVTSICLESRVGLQSNLYILDNQSSHRSSRFFWMFCCDLVLRQIYILLSICQRHNIMPRQPARLGKSDTKANSVSRPTIYPKQTRLALNIDLATAYRTLVTLQYRAKHNFPFQNLLWKSSLHGCMKATLASLIAPPQGPWGNRREEQLCRDTCKSTSTSLSSSSATQPRNVAPRATLYI